jgi:hypothetical protein
VRPLTEAELQPIVVEALARWSAVPGLPTLTIEDVRVEIVDLPDGAGGRPMLGYTAGTVWIDADAGGFGWFIDATPSDDAEFSAATRSATLASPAWGRMDLLTVVLHEVGHLFGLQDVPDGGDVLMAETLLPGARRLPGLRGLDPAAADRGSTIDDRESQEGVFSILEPRSSILGLPPARPHLAAGPVSGPRQAGAPRTASPLDAALMTFLSAAGDGFRPTWIVGSEPNPVAVQDPREGLVEALATAHAVAFAQGNPAAGQDNRSWLAAPVPVVALDRVATLFTAPPLTDRELILALDAAGAGDLVLVGGDEDMLLLGESGSDDLLGGMADDGLEERLPKVI